MSPAPKLEHRAQDTERIPKIHRPARFRRLGRWAKRRGGICRPNSIVLRLLGEPPPPPPPSHPQRKTRWSTRNNRRRKRVGQLVRRRGSCRVLRLRPILLATSFWQLLLSRLTLALFFSLSLSFFFPPLAGALRDCAGNHPPAQLIAWRMKAARLYASIQATRLGYALAGTCSFLARFCACKTFRYHDLGPVEDIVNISACLRLPVAIEWNTRIL